MAAFYEYTFMSFTSLQNLNNIGSSLNQQFATVPGPVTVPRTNPILSPVATGVLTSGSGLQAVGNLGSATVSTTTTTPITTPNTGTINTPTITRSREEMRQVLAAANNQNTTPAVEESVWDKNKVWIVAAIAVILIGTGLYFLLKK